jgi:cell division protein FtsN
METLMLLWFFLLGIIVGVIIGLTLVYRTAVSPLHKEIERLSNQIKLLSTKPDESTEEKQLEENL